MKRLRRKRSAISCIGRSVGCRWKWPVLKKDRTSRLNVAEKQHCVEPEYRQLSVFRQCALIGSSRSSYYRQDEVGTESKENLVMMLLIDEEYTRRPFYGSRKMRDWLRCQEHHVNRKRSLYVPVPADSL